MKIRYFIMGIALSSIFTMFLSNYSCNKSFERRSMIYYNVGWKMGANSCSSEVLTYGSWTPPKAKERLTADSLEFLRVLDSVKKAN